MTHSLKSRLINIEISNNDGFHLLIDHNLGLEAIIQKAVGNNNVTATITLNNLTEQQRNTLISRVSKYNYWYNKKNTDKAKAAWIMDIAISAGYEDKSQLKTTQIFKGQLITAELLSSPPDIGVKLIAMTNYFSRSHFKFRQSNGTLTFKQFAQWVGTQLNLRVVCKTAHDDHSITNVGIGAANGQGLLSELSKMFSNLTKVWIDQDTLYVVDVGQYTIDDEELSYDNFLGVPQYDETGAHFKIMFDHRLTLAKKVRLKSQLDPLTFQNQSFVVTKCEYHLSSRSNDFFVTAWCQQ